MCLEAGLQSQLEGVEGLEVVPARRRERELPLMLRLASTGLPVGEVESGAAVPDDAAPYFSIASCQGSQFVPPLAWKDATGGGSETARPNHSSRQYFAWRPTGQASFHYPQAFGILRLR